MATDLDTTFDQCALKESIALRNQKSLLELMGKLDWDDSFDYKEKRNRPQEVAKRLGCDPDLKAFDRKLGKIAKAATQSKAAKPK